VSCGGYENNDDGMGKGGIYSPYGFPLNLNGMEMEMEDLNRKVRFPLLALTTQRRDPEVQTQRTR
jgi:hypothetical protein